MSGMDLVRYRARDGLEIPAFLTLPRSAEVQKNLPLVVYVHGGPWSRGPGWRWQGDVQFLASRGYAVLQPEFRGSVGFGGKHFRASFKQWGLSMQDDLADGARWAIAQGIADPKRICIMGASYGGLRHADGAGQGWRPVPLRCGLGGRVRHPADVRCALERHVQRVEALRHAADDRRPPGRCREVGRHFTGEHGQAHPEPAAHRPRPGRPPCAHRTRQAAVRRGQAAQPAGGVGGVRQGRSRLEPAGDRGSTGGRVSRPSWPGTSRRPSSRQVQPAGASRRRLARACGTHLWRAQRRHISRPRIHSSAA
jgi:hypothetical protein